MKLNKLIWILAMCLLVMPSAFPAINKNFIRNDKNESLNDGRTFTGEGVANDGYLFFSKVGRRSYSQFALNNSIYPAATTLVYEAYACYFASDTVEQTGAVVDIHHVNTTHPGVSIDETTLTDLNQPCGVSFDDGERCNLTIASSVTVGSSTVNLQYCFNITSMVARQIRLGEGNVTVVVRSTTSTGANNNAFWSTEGTTRPTLNITFDPVGLTAADTTPPAIQSINLSRTTYKVNETINITINITDITGISDVRITLNDSINYSMTLLNGDLYQLSRRFALENYNISYIFVKDTLGNTNLSYQNIQFNITLPSLTTTTTPSCMKVSTGCAVYFEGGCSVIR